MPDSRSLASTGTAIIAHRGDSGAAPENTLAAFGAAVDSGADGVEFDVQLSSDGVPVVIHDERLERTTNGSGWVNAHSAADLARLEAGLWRDPPLAGQGVPTLAAVLELLAASPLTLNIELKTNRLPYPGIVPAVLAAVNAAGVGARVTLSSFNHRTLREAHQAVPELPCAVLLEQVLLEPWDYAAGHGFAAVHPDHAMVDAELVQRCHERGLAVRAYTVDDEAEARRLFALGVDAIITNEPARVRTVREGGGAG